MTMKETWAASAARFARADADAWSGGTRKILRGRRVTFEDWNDDSLQAADLGYSAAKVKQLERYYFNAESHRAAVDGWDYRRRREKFGSVGFSTINHAIKGGDTVDEVLKKRSKHGSVSGPCMLAVAVTYIDARHAEIEVTYRSVCYFKKFPADLIFLRDKLLASFDFGGMTTTLTARFANLTAHPYYWAVVLPFLDDPVDAMRSIAERDEKFHRHLVKATADYLLPEAGDTIANYAAAQRVKKHAKETIKGPTLRDLKAYLRRYAA